MTKTYKFNKTTNSNNFPFHTTNYSKILDNIILSDIIKKNDYLFDNNNSCENFTSLINNKKVDDFIKASNILANYKKYKKYYNFPYIIGKMYELSDGTRIVFYEDEVQIDFDTYSYSDFANISFINNLTPKKKDIIINIFTDADINININLL